MKIKVCGMREASNILALSGLGPDYLGLIFYPASKRYADHLDPAMLERLPSQIRKTGVFVNEKADLIMQKVRQFKLNAVQLHGQETPDYCRGLRLAINTEDSGIELIKAFGVNEAFDFGLLNDYRDDVDFFLFDTKTPEHGGSGVKFNWQLLEKYQLDKPFFLSGGLDTEDLTSLKQLNIPGLYAVDINSRFETAPGIKDITKVKAAIHLIRSSSIR